MTPPPCNCAHNETLVVWKHRAKAPIKQQHDRCIHPNLRESTAFMPRRKRGGRVAVVAFEFRILSAIM